MYLQRPKRDYMNYKSIPLVLIAATLFIACNNTSTGGKLSSPSAPVNMTVPTTSPGSPVVQQPVQALPNTNTTITSQPITTVTQPSTPVTTTAVGLNPAHGQPGHRCDIAVGAPLNSAPTTPAVTPTTAANNSPIMVKSNPQPVETQKTFTTPTNTTATAAGLNPEHGKPGHRCDIAVGAPLDSKPAATPSITTSPATNTPVTPTIAQPVTPVLPATNTTPGTAATGLNPEHGKPGHRCDIAVGAPLDSKPVEIKKEKN